MDLATGNMSSGKLLYVQYIDQSAERAQEITDSYLNDFILKENISALYFTDYASENRKIKEGIYSNIDILKNPLSHKIVHVYVYSCPMIISGKPRKLKITSHAYAVFQTQDTEENQKCWWSFEKNGEYIVLQQSTDKEHVTHHISERDATTKNRPKEVKEEISASAKAQTSLQSLLTHFWNAGQLPQSYHLFLSNCWQFAELIFEKVNHEGKKWTPPVGNKTLKIINPFSSTVIERSGLDAGTVMSINFDENASLRLALWDDDLDEFKRLLNEHTESANFIDSHGYTLLEWAQVFSEQSIEYLTKKFVHEDANSSQQNSHTLFIALLGDKTPLEEFVTDELVNATNSLGETPLHLAAKLSSCTIDSFQMILDRSTKDHVNKVDNIGYTPLHWAVYTRSLEKIKRLIEKGADVKINKKAGSPLHLAVLMWSHATEEELKKLKESLAEEIQSAQAHEMKNKNGYTALHLALVLQSTPMVEFLLENKADVNIATDDGSTSLHLAAQWPGCPENLLCRILESTRDWHSKNKRGRTALHCALESHQSIACEALLRKMEKCGKMEECVNIVTEDGEIALHLAANWSGINAELFKKILGQTKNVNATDNKGKTPLHCALLGKSRTATGELLNVGATVNRSEDQKFTAIHLAALWSDIPPELFDTILDNFKANLNDKDPYGRTALHCAIMSKSETSIEKLLKASADASIPVEDFHLTPLHLAAEWRQPYNYSPENVTDISTSLFDKILEKCSDTVNAQNHRGETALHFALASRSKTATSALLDHKDLNVNIVAYDGEMPIHQAAKWKSIDFKTFEIIVEKTENLSQKYQANTALQIAKESKLPAELINRLQEAMNDRQ